jgi:Tfp pilus assembly protein PilO
MEFDRPIAIAIIIFITILFAFFLVVPEYTKLQDMRVQVAQKTAEYRAQFDYFGDISRTYYNLQDKKAELQKIDDALPSKPDFGQLIYFFQAKSKDNGLALKNFALSQAGSGAGVKPITFSLSLVGNYSSLKNFVSYLEKSARLFEIVSISFGSAGQQLTTKKQTNQFQNLEIFTYNLEVKMNSY